MIYAATSEGVVDVESGAAIVAGLDVGFFTTSTRSLGPLSLDSA